MFCSHYMSILICSNDHMTYATYTVSYTQYRPELFKILINMLKNHQVWGGGVVVNIFSKMRILFQ